MPLDPRCTDFFWGLPTRLNGFKGQPNGSILTSLHAFFHSFFFFLLFHFVPNPSLNYVNLQCPPITTIQIANTESIHSQFNSVRVSLINHVNIPLGSHPTLLIHANMDESSQTTDIEVHFGSKMSFTF